MAKFKPQYRRILFIDQKLREAAGRERLPNCTSLAEEWETSPKTIQRDIEFLKWDMGAPIEYDRVRHGYYYTEMDFVLPALRIAEGDLFAICLAEKVLRQYENTPLHARLALVFAKIEQCLPEQVTVHPSAVDERFSFIPEAAPRIDPAIWEEAFRALRLGHTLDMTYQRPGQSAAYETRVDPYHAVGFRGEWYIIGHCHYKKALRMFGISRIRKAKVSGDAFQIPADFDFDKQWRNHFGVMVGSNEVTVRVRFEAAQAPYVRERDWHPEQQFEEGKDGSLTMSFKTRHLFEVTRWVLSWGAAATALEPPELVDAVREELAGAARKYRSRRDKVPPPNRPHVGRPQ